MKPRSKARLQYILTTRQYKKPIRCILCKIAGYMIVLIYFLCIQDEFPKLAFIRTKSYQIVPTTSVPDRDQILETNILWQIKGSSWFLWFSILQVRILAMVMIFPKNLMMQFYFTSKLETWLSYSLGFRSYKPISKIHVLYGTHLYINKLTTLCTSVLSVITTSLCFCRWMVMKYNSCEQRKKH